MKAQGFLTHEHQVACHATQVPKPQLSIEDAMQLYGLTSFELLWERERDTKALMAWNEDTLVLAFRGTASLRNVIADIQARSAIISNLALAHVKDG